jgi:hypothetical protein
MKTHYSAANTQTILLEKQKNDLLVILTEYIDKTIDKDTTLLKLKNLDPTAKTTATTTACSNC